MTIGRYSMGMEQHPDSPDNNRLGSFAAGMARAETALHVGRFSAGMEQHPDSPANNRVGSFATGMAREEAAARVVAVIPERRLPPKKSAA
jgi:hypothetical protein